MTDVINSPNMGLPVPVVSEDPGPDWASNLNACLSAIDSHNHSSGQGVSVTPDGIDINNDLPMNNNNLVTARSVRFSPQSAALANAADIGCLYENGVDLYYIDGSGNDIRITQSGSVTGSAGTITGLPSGTASASFSAGTFTFQKSTNTPASINAGSIKIGQEVASGFGVTVSASGSQAANYNLSLPQALPASAKFLTVDASGNVGDSYDVDNSSLEVVSSSIQVKAAGVTRAMLAPVGSGRFRSTQITYSNGSGSYTQVSNGSVTTTGRDVMITLVPLGSSGSVAYIQIASATGSTGASFKVLRDGVEMYVSNLFASSLGSNVNNRYPPNTLCFYDRPTAGTYNYELQAKNDSGTTVDVNEASLFIYEMA